MLRIIIISILFIMSLVNFFPVPSRYVWYVGIAVPEFCHIFIIATVLLLMLCLARLKYRVPCLLIGTITLIIFCSPIVRAYNIANGLTAQLQQSFGGTPASGAGFHQPEPYRLSQMFTGNGAKQIPYKTYQYATHGGVNLSLNFTPAALPGIRPCLLVVHGGSWTRGDNSEIAAVNNYFANVGYQVATVNYRLAPQFHSPAPQDDVKAAFNWLRANAAMLNIDTNNFVLLGKSAGAQIVLTAAYTFNEPAIKGVAAFYGPNDMVWSYSHWDNPLIMDSRKVQRDFLGGAPNEVPERYVAESPIMHVTAHTVPTLLVHGMVDAHVYFEQSVRLHHVLDSAGVKNMLLALPWATHGCEFNLNGPSGQLSMYSVEWFMRSVFNK